MARHHCGMWVRKMQFRGKKRGQGMQQVVAGSTCATPAVREYCSQLYLGSSINCAQIKIVSKNSSLFADACLQLFAASHIRFSNVPGKISSLRLKTSLTKLNQYFVVCLDTRCVTFPPKSYR